MRGWIYFRAKTLCPPPVMSAGLKTSECSSHSGAAEAKCRVFEFMAASSPCPSVWGFPGVFTSMRPRAIYTSSISSCQCQGMASSGLSVWLEEYPAQGNSALPCG